MKLLETLRGRTIIKILIGCYLGFLISYITVNNYYLVPLGRVSVNGATQIDPSLFPRMGLLVRDSLSVVFLLLFIVLIFLNGLRKKGKPRQIKLSKFWVIVDMGLTMVIIPSVLFSTASIVLEGPGFLNSFLTEELARVSLLLLFVWVALFMCDKTGVVVKD